MNVKSILSKALFFSSVTILSTWLIQPAIAACSMIHTVGSNYDELDDWKVTTRIIPVKLKGVQTTVHKGTFSQSVIRNTEAGQYIVAIASPGHERLFKSINHTCSDSQSQRRYSHTLNVKSGKLIEANIRLPFTSKKQKITLRVKNGNAYAFGDIALGPLDELLRHNTSESPKSYYKGLPQFAGRAPKSPQFSRSNPNQIAGFQTKRQPLAWVNDPTMLWPNGVLRYAMTLIQPQPSMESKRTSSEVNFGKSRPSQMSALLNIHPLLMISSRHRKSKTLSELSRVQIQVLVARHLSACRGECSSSN